jgi:uncharacterized protein
MSETGMPEEGTAEADHGGATLRPPNHESLARTLVEAIHAGEVERVRELVRENRDLASARLVDHKGGSGTPLHAATDWPGYFPNGPRIVAVLIDAGADPNIPVEGSWHAETPLHWAASSDDVEVARALIDGGADIEATGRHSEAAHPSTTPSAMGAGRWPVSWSSGERRSTLAKRRPWV